MHKFFSYFNTLTGTREISDNNRWTIGFSQVRTQNDEKIMEEISDYLKNLNQINTNIEHLFDGLEIDDEQKSKIELLKKQSDFIQNSILNIQIALFNDPFRKVDPGIHIDDKSICNTLKNIKKQYIDFANLFITLEKNINISEINRLALLVEQTIQNIFNQIDYLIEDCK